MSLDASFHPHVLRKFVFRRKIQILNSCACDLIICIYYKRASLPMWKHAEINTNKLWLSLRNNIRKRWISLTPPYGICCFCNIRIDRFVTLLRDKNRICFFLSFSQSQCLCIALRLVCWSESSPSRVHISARKSRELIPVAYSIGSASGIGGESGRRRASYYGVC